MADRFGPRVVLAVAMAWWAIFTAAMALSFNAVSLAATRLLFGAGEAAAFPAGSRALVPWLPLKRRAFGQCFQHSGARLGAAVAPAVVVRSQRERPACGRGTDPTDETTRDLANGRHTGARGFDVRIRQAVAGFGRSLLRPDRGAGRGCRREGRGVSLPTRNSRTTPSTFERHSGI
jgi:Major Facilitator Superfamily